jgi:hypothetical protein
MIDALASISAGVASSERAEIDVLILSLADRCAAFLFNGNLT